MNLSHGGHLTHGHPLNFSGRYFKVVAYGVRREDERIDYDAILDLARQHNPRVIVAGASAYPRSIDFVAIRKAADACGAVVMADIAHIAGLVAVGLHPSPVPHAGSSQDHPRDPTRASGRMILCRRSGPTSSCSRRAGRPQSRHRREAVAFRRWRGLRALRRCRRAGRWPRRSGRGWRLVSGGTDNHLLLVGVAAPIPAAGRGGPRPLIHRGNCRSL
jgi:glycine hydroxymethyltransferase